MNPIDLQFQSLKQYESDAHLLQPGDGSAVVVIPNIQLPSGWNKSTTTLLFIAPVGYPFARPDCFWTDHDLRLANGAIPQNSQLNPVPNFPGQYWWFSWHLAAWDPNNDTLVTYLNVIKRRLHELK
jgi:hypothetical protein